MTTPAGLLLGSSTSRTLSTEYEISIVVDGLGDDMILPAGLAGDLWHVERQLRAYIDDGVLQRINIGLYHRSDRLTLPRLGLLRRSVLFELT